LNAILRAGCRRELRGCFGELLHLDTSAHVCSASGRTSAGY